MMMFHNHLVNAWPIQCYVHNPLRTVSCEENSKGAKSPDLTPVLFCLLRKPIRTFSKKKEKK